MSPLVISVLFLSMAIGTPESDYGIGTCAVKHKTCTESNTITLSSSKTSKEWAEEINKRVKKPSLPESFITPPPQDKTDGSKKTTYTKM